MQLPDWLESNLPIPRPIEYITYADGKFYFRGVGYDSLIEAYDSAKPDANVDFHESVMDKMGWTEDDFFLTEKGHNRLLVTCTDQTYRWLVETAFTSAQGSIKHWRDNKDDFHASYYMLDTHPAFWTRLKVEPTTYWQDSGIVSARFWFAPSTSGMMMECGAHIAPDYTDTYHDLRLDTYGKSFEDCIVQTAALVDKFFHEDGTERENVEYEKSELELTLESQMAERKAQNE